MKQMKAAIQTVFMFLCALGGLAMVADHGSQVVRAAESADEEGPIKLPADIVSPLPQLPFPRPTGSASRMPGPHNWNSIA